MRISGGDFRGRRLANITGRSIRPTPEHIREAIFNIIGQDLSDTLVLDLFSGSGVLGLESISRGATRALLVDVSSNALSIIRKNIDLLRVRDKVTVLRHDLSRGLGSVYRTMPAFDVVFLDPPYNTDLALPVLKELDDCLNLRNSGLVIVEHFSKELSQVSLNVLHKVKQKSYGQTTISMFKKMNR